MSDHREIPLTRGLVARVSPEDYARLSRFSWQAYRPHKSSATFYAKRSVRVGGKTTTILMHRQITGCPPHLTVDHIDGIGLNNVRDNLRTCTIAENIRSFHEKRREDKRMLAKPSQKMATRAYDLRRLKLAERIDQDGLTRSEIARAIGYTSEAGAVYVRQVLLGRSVSNPVLTRIEAVLDDLKAEQHEATA